MDKLAARLARGEQAAVAELYDACAPSVFHYLLFRLGAREDAAEVLQEVFLRLVRSRKSLAKVRDLRAYVFTIARNEANRFSARSSRRKETSSSLELFVAVDTVEGVDLQESIVAALRRLDKNEAEIVQMKIYSGLTFREISTILDLPQGTVATRYRAALARLRMWLSRDFA